MKKTPIKAISVILAASMMLSFAACNKKGGSGSSSGSREKSHSGNKISADTPWFNSNILDVNLKLDTDRDVEYTYESLVGADKDRIIIMTSGSYKIPDEANIDWETFNYNEYAINYVSVINRASKKVDNQIDLTESIPDGGYLESARYEDGKIVAKIYSYNETTYEASYKEISIDIATGKTIDSVDLGMNEDGVYYERSFTLGDYRVDTETNWEGENGSYNLYITSPDGNQTKVELKEAGKDYYDIPVVLSKDENTAVVPVSVGGGFKYFELDLKTCEIKEADEKEYEWLDLDQCYYPFTDEDGSVYFTTSVGISKINFNKKCMEQVFDFSWCNVNRSILSNLEIAEISDDSFILCGDNYNGNPYQMSSSSEFVLVEFNKAETNPHAGKTILELYSPYGYTQDKIADSILKFNEENKEYFIEVSDRYSSLDDADYSDINSQDQYEQISLTSDAKLSNQLAMDILNGEGPDILMNVSYYGQLNSSNYLTDLSDYIGNLSSDKYFTNVIDASRVDGKLYNLPICFVVEGIHTDAKYAGKSGVGFTTKEYEKFLNETLNGNDIVNSGQAYYFAKLYTAMADKFIVNGKADFSCSEFADLAEFVKNNVPENAKSYDEMYEEDDWVDASYAVGASITKADMGYESVGPAMESYCYGLSSYLTEIVQLQGGMAILGYPSADGRGPLVEPYISVAISAQANNPDACGEFVKMLLSDELQRDFAMNDNFVINREAFREAGKVCIDYFNKEGYESYFGYDDNLNQKRIKFTDEHIDAMENIIVSCSNTNSKDSAINLILIEEMPAYFSGQKDLKAVVEIAQDRVQKVLDERG
ncbi:MAG: extracellular solute-binding protein [Saccharofermentans sp.]|nr:extracellular solute-binding protein [Saccharofermentans sp.]